MLMKLQASTNTCCLFLVSILLYFNALSHQHACSHQDEASLFAFFASISTPSSHPLDWSPSISCCLWEGIDCDADGRVTHLWLPSRGLKGEVSVSLGNLVGLSHLNLSHNSIYGLLPHELFASLRSLQVIDVSSNHLSGMIPQGIGNLSKLEELDVHTNNLTGPIPLSLMNCTSLVNIILRDNHLEGNISVLDFSRLIRLQKLDLWRNKFTGNLPESIYLCKSIVALRVAANNLTGQISPNIVKLTSLSFLSLTNNSFTNITSALRILVCCRNLTFLSIGENFHKEMLPSDSSFICSNGFQKLQHLYLGGSNLSGLFPEWLSNLKSLQFLDLRNNQIGGRIPDWLGTLPNLTYIDLSANLFSGEFPESLCRLPALGSEKVDTNSSELPIFSLYHNWHEYRQFAIYPRTIYLENNNISGMIPSAIGRLKYLQALYLGHNNLSGYIPGQISNLKRLEKLDLSQNKLEGEIPMSLRSLSFLSDFNVSYNNLQGPIPSGGQFDTFPQSSFEGNSGLCGEIVYRTCSNKKGPSTREQRIPPFLDGFAVGFASGFAGFLAVAASCICYKFYV